MTTWNELARAFIAQEQVDVADVARESAITPGDWTKVCRAYDDERYRAELARAIVEECERRGSIVDAVGDL
jgi:hypothetical protein